MPTTLTAGSEVLYQNDVYYGDNSNQTQQLLKANKVSVLWAKRLIGTDVSNKTIYFNTASDWSSTGDATHWYIDQIDALTTSGGYTIYVGGPPSIYIRKNGSTISGGTVYDYTASVGNKWKMSSYTFPADAGTITAILNSGNPTLGRGHNLLGELDILIPSADFLSQGYEYMVPYYGINNVQSKLTQQYSPTTGASYFSIVENADGKLLAALTNYAGGSSVTLNGASKSSSTASFYAPVTDGTAGYELVANGPGSAPVWKQPSGYLACSTAAGTTAKTVSCANFKLATGATCTIKFTYTNSASTPTLNVNSTGAKTIYYKGAIASSSNTWQAGEIVTFAYDGQYWQSIAYNLIPSGGGITPESVLPTTLSTGSEILYNGDVYYGDENSSVQKLAKLDYTESYPAWTASDVGTDLSGKTVYFNNNNYYDGGYQYPADINEDVILTTSGGYQIDLGGYTHQPDIKILKNGSEVQRIYSYGGVYTTHEYTFPSDAGTILYFGETSSAYTTSNLINLNWVTLGNPAAGGSSKTYLPFFNQNNVEKKSGTYTGTEYTYNYSKVMVGDNGKLVVGIPYIPSMPANTKGVTDSIFDYALGFDSNYTTTITTLNTTSYCYPGEYTFRINSSTGGIPSQLSLSSAVISVNLRSTATFYGGVSTNYGRQVKQTLFVSHSGTGTSATKIGRTFERFVGYENGSSSMSYGAWQEVLNVEADPAGPSVGTLSTIKIGNNIYDLPSGGGGSQRYGHFIAISFENPDDGMPCNVRFYYEDTSSTPINSRAKIYSRIFHSIGDVKLGVPVTGDSAGVYTLSGELQCNGGSASLGLNLLLPPLFPYQQITVQLSSLSSATYTDTVATL